MGMRRTRAGGFTLIEMMVTLTIAATLIAAIGSMLVQTMKQKSEVERDIRSHQIGPAILRIIAEDLQAAFVYRLNEVDESAATEGTEGETPAPEAGTNNQQNDVDFFVGESSGDGITAQDELNFVTSVDSMLRIGTKQSDVTEVGYFLKETQDARLPGLFTLYRREDFHVDNDPVEGGKIMKMYDRVVALQFRYLPRPENESDQINIVEGNADWEREWDNTEDGGLPWAVEASVWIDTRENPNNGVEAQPGDIRRYRTIILLPAYASDEELQEIQEENSGDTGGTNNNGGGTGNGNGTGNGGGTGGGGTGG